MLKGEIWIVDLSGTVGSEQYGIRPCLVVQNDMGNLHSPTTIVLPITKQNKRFKTTHVSIKCLTEVDSIVLCEQPRTVDKQRFKKYICNLDADKMKMVQEKIMLTFGL